MDVRLSASTVHLDAMPPVRLIALINPAKVRRLEAPIAIRDGAADDGGVGHFSRILLVCYNFPNLFLGEL